MEELATPSLLTNVGVVGILVLMILDRVFSFVKSRTSSGDDTADKISDLWDWHNLRDDDGVPVWYVRKSLEEAIRLQAESMAKLADNIGEQTRVLERLVERQTGPSP